MPSFLHRLSSSGHLTGILVGMGHAQEPVQKFIPRHLITPNPQTHKETKPSAPRIIWEGRVQHQSWVGSGDTSAARWEPEWGMAELEGGVDLRMAGPKPALISRTAGAAASAIKADRVPLTFASHGHFPQQSAQISGEASTLSAPAKEGGVGWGGSRLS